MQRVIKLRNWFAQSRKNRIFISGSDRVYGRDWSRLSVFPQSVKISAAMPFSRDHGIVLSGMWSRESELQYPAWKFPDCFLLQSGHGFSAAVSRNLFCDGCSRLGIDRKESCG